MTSKEKAAKKLGPIAQGVGKLGMLALLADEIKKPDKLDAKADAALKEEELASARSTRQMREDYANKVYRYLIGYSIGAFVLVFLDGFQILGFNIDAGPLAVIVGSTAVSAIGLVGFVVSGLFRSK